MSGVNREASPINVFFNRTADVTGGWADGLLKYHLRRPRSTRDYVSRDLDGVFTAPMILVFRSVQGLASLSASITGGRRPHLSQ